MFVLSANSTFPCVVIETSTSVLDNKNNTPHPPPLAVWCEIITRDFIFCFNKKYHFCQEISTKSLLPYRSLLAINFLLLIISYRFSNLPVLCNHSAVHVPVGGTVVCVRIFVSPLLFSLSSVHRRTKTNSGATPSPSPKVFGGFQWSVPKTGLFD